MTLGPRPRPRRRRRRRGRPGRWLRSWRLLPGRGHSRL